MYIDLNEIINRHNKLCKDIHNFQLAYYDGHPLISDAEFDLLWQELLALEDQYGDKLDLSSSPTQRVGKPSKFYNSKEYYRHYHPMLSLDNIWNQEDLKKYISKIARLLGKELSQLYCECKADGIAINIQYHAGKITKILSRGDGNIGEDITKSMIHHPNIPNFIPHQDTIEIRAEAVIHHQDFYEQLSTRFSNPRNAVSGIIRSLEINAKDIQLLQIYAFDLIVPSNSTKTLNNLVNYNDLLAQLAQYGFKALKGELTQVDQISQSIAMLHDLSLPYKIDGIVLKVYNLTDRLACGYTARAPRGLVAYKFSPPYVITVLKQVLWQVGRLGSIVPVACFTPVDIDGSIVSRSTLHNFDIIQELKLGIGDNITLTRSGGVIPKIINSLDKSNSIVPPTHCPSCKSELNKLICKADWQCPGQRIERMKHFVSRNALDIKGLGDKLIQELIARDLVFYPCEIFNLTLEQISSLPGMRSKRPEKIYHSIKQGLENRILSRWIYALSIPSLGARAASLLTQKYPTWDQLFQGDLLTFQEILGPNIGKEVYEYIINNLEILNKFRDCYIN